jgi:nucleotide-binding universal stress UspA family protein
MGGDFRPLTKFLLPVDSKESFRRPAALAGNMASALGDRVEQVTFLHVMGGRYLGEHMKNIDIRTDFVLETDLFKRLQQQYIEKEVRPLLEEAQETLTSCGCKAPTNLEIRDGKPVREIIRFSTEGSYSTIIIERRGLSSLHRALFGSVSAGLLHSNVAATIYLVGSEAAAADRHAPVRRCLLALDGSVPSEVAAREAAILLGGCVEGLETVILLYVIGTDRYAEQVAGQCPVDKDVQSVFELPKRGLLESGVPESIIREDVRCGGNPADLIVEEVEKAGCDMVFMGRQGRSALKELFMGSVSQGVINKALQPTIALTTG